MRFENAEEIVVEADVLVEEGAELFIGPGCRVTIAEDASIQTVNGAICISGGPADEDRVRIAPIDGGFNQIAAEGSSGILEVLGADVSGGRLYASEGAALRIADSFIHDFPGVIIGSSHANVAVLRTHVRGYYETLFRWSFTTIQFCLFEKIESDGVDFDYAEPGSLIAHCAFRDGTGTNIDAIDIGSESVGVTIQNCLIENFALDKGVSIGESTVDAVVENCLIRQCAIGVAVKDSSNALVKNCAILECDFGLSAYEKFPDRGPGFLTAIDSIVWDCETPVETRDESVIEASYCTLNTTEPFPGVRNFNDAPVFRNALANDFRLIDDSLLLTASSKEGPIGVHYPIGGTPAPVTEAIVAFRGLRTAGFEFSFNTGEKAVEAPAAEWFVELTDSNGAPVAIDGAGNWDELLLKALDRGSSYRMTVLRQNFLGQSPPVNLEFTTDDDADQDGMGDAWEQSFGLDATDPEDATLDPDQDGFTNREEWRCNTDPRDAESKFIIDSISKAPSPPNVEPTFLIASGAAAWRTLQLFWKGLEANQTWTAGNEFTVFGSSAETSLTAPANSIGRAIKLKIIGEP